MRKGTTVLLSLVAAGAFIYLLGCSSKPAQAPTGAVNQVAPMVNPCPNPTLILTTALTDAPDTCVSLNYKTKVSWRDSNGARFSITMPDWTNTTKPTWSNADFPTNCDGTTSACSTTKDISNAAIWTVVRYSVSRPGVTTIYGHIIIKP